MHIIDSQLSSFIPLEDILQPVVIADMPGEGEWDGKHPLERSWSFWYLDNTKSNFWGDTIIELGSFSTIEDFWSYHHYIKPLGMMKMKSDIMLFKRGIQPKWEDPNNANGGRWALNFDKAASNMNQLEEYWLNLMMDLIGETLGDLTDIVAGAIVNRRERNNRISIWTTTTCNQDGRLLALGRKIKEKLQIPNDVPMIFQIHERFDVKKNTNPGLTLHKI